MGVPMLMTNRPPFSGAAVSCLRTSSSSCSSVPFCRTSIALRLPKSVHRASSFFGRLLHWFGSCSHCHRTPHQSTGLWRRLLSGTQPAKEPSVVWSSWVTTFFFLGCLTLARVPQTQDSWLAFGRQVGAMGQAASIEEHHHPVTHTLLSNPVTLKLSRAQDSPEALEVAHYQ